MVPCLQPMAHLLTFPTTPMFTLPTHLHLLFLHLQLLSPHPLFPLLPQATLHLPLPTTPISHLHPHACPQLMQFLLTLLQAWVCHQPATHLQLFPLEGSRLSPHPSLHLACRLSGD